jgi:benzaldehyde dehydrogenase (NAD)
MATGRVLVHEVAGELTRPLVEKANLLRVGDPAQGNVALGPLINERQRDRVALANDTEYGLSAAVISRSVGRAMAIADRLEAGLVHVNDQSVNDELTNPFGGTGLSGNHTHMGGPADVGVYTRWRWLTVKDSAPPYPF